ncbi:hypothetical protein L1987_01926 [Smallanthus sonchifolius]|uniref:Uncharacterized protein n=1 Tax=Smallanthus sonchifolius TaxID=185202 RepID=A0ACB9K6K2_9ASTR|nr:hypothetical protein L1987_01926 [Smallanthus sonchifolius]
MSDGDGDWKRAAAVAGSVGGCHRFGRSNDGSPYASDHFGLEISRDDEVVVNAGGAVAALYIMEVVVMLTESREGVLHDG